MDVHCNHSYEDLNIDEIKMIETRMYPGQYSDEGFLQTGESLFEICENDRQYLQSINITYKQIVDFLTSLIKKWKDPRYKITEVSYLGFQECPFQNYLLDDEDHNEYGDSDITITDKTTGESITFNTLLLHMIEAHHFFESPLVSHRLDPKKIIEMFNLQPKVSYELQYKDYYKWKNTNCFNNCTKENIGLISKIALKQYQINKNLVILLFPGYFDFDSKTLKYIRENKFSWKIFIEQFYDYDNNNVLARMRNYEETGDLLNMCLYIFNISSEKQLYNISIEGNKIEYDGSNIESSYIYTRYREIL
jgi:hypothetical protein